MLALHVIVIFFLIFSEISIKNQLSYNCEKCSRACVLSCLKTNKPFNSLSGSVSAKSKSFKS